MIPNLIFLSLCWLAPTICIKGQREMVTSGATCRLHIQCHQQGSVEWIEKAIAAVSRSSFWDSANFSAICLELPAWTRRELTGTSEGGVQLQGLHRAWLTWMRACQEDKYWTHPVSTASLRLSQIWEDHLGWLFDTACVILCGGAGCVQALQTMEDWEIKPQTFLIKFFWSL